MIIQEEMRYGSEQHTRIKNAIWARYNLSRDKMTEYHDRWTDGEEMFQAYTKETDNDALRDMQRDDGKPQYTTLIIPFPYAMALTAHTYYASVFLARNPVFQFSARHGRPEMQVQGVEALIDYQVNVGKMLVPLYIWLLDPLRYGMGVIGNYWADEKVTVSRFTEVQDLYMGMIPTGNTKKVRETVTVPGYQGNKLFNVRPFDFYPDPRVPVSQLQEGEFAGRTTEVGWNTIIRGSKDGKYFNIEALRRMRARSQRDSITLGSPKNIMPGDELLGSDQADELDMGYTSLLEMHIELIPKDWKLGTSTAPEIWAFTLANEEVVIEARPAGEWHAKFPYFVQEYEFNGYELIARSMMDISKPLGDTLSWLVNTHFFNVRKSLNDQLVADPSRVVMKDLTDPNAGRIIRLKPAAYGQDTRTVVSQLAVQDITQGHLRDAQIVMDMLQRVTGVSDSVMGAIGQGGRKTATEIRTSSSFGVNRLKTNAEYMSAMAWGPLAEVLLQNTQQYYDKEEQFRIAGDAFPQSQYMMVTPESIQGFYDFVPVDGTMPIDRFAQANLWKELMAGMAKMPPILQQYDLGKIFAYTARLAGAKNIDQFRIDIQTPEQIAAGVQAGNVVPIGGGDAAGMAGNVGGRSAEDFGRVAEPGQIPGMGSSG
ncbi:MAG: portal protein [bacterium]